MKNAVLVLLLILLPWQSVLAAERQLMHVLGSGHIEVVVQHMVEHATHVLHHHDDDGNADGAPHVDDSHKSVQHLADVEHGGTMCILAPALPVPGMLLAERSAPSLPPDAFSDRTTIPLLRPPRALA